MQRQILCLLLLQAGDLFPMQALLNISEERVEICILRPVRMQDGIQVLVIAIAPERLPQLPPCFQPHNTTYLYSFL